MTDPLQQGFEAFIERAVARPGQSRHAQVAGIRMHYLEWPGPAGAPALLLPRLGRDLRELLYPSEAGEEAASAALRETWITQPALFTVEYAIGGNGAASVGTVAAAMAGVHVLIGIGEGVITALTVSAVLRVRPDLVYGADALRRPVPAIAVTGGVS